MKGSHASMDGAEKALGVVVQPATAPAKRVGTMLELLFCIVGIMGCFLVYGLLQERLMTTEYGPGVKFTDSAFLVLCNRVVGATIAIVMLHLRSESVRPSAPLSSFGLVSLSNFVATYCQYDALKYVSFPTQTLGKCGKAIPVMVIGAALYKKRYEMRDVAVALVVMLGCAMFLMSGKISKSDQHDSFYGLFLMAMYLGADGFTSTAQERLFEGHKASTYNQMLYVNLISCGFSIATLLSGNRLFEALNFAVEYPNMILDALMLSVAAASGQMVILFTIKTFGAFVFATIMTIRQFLSMLLSSLFFGHPLTAGQWLGAIVVFGVLYLNDAYKKPKHHHHHHPEPAADSASPLPLPSESLQEKSDAV